MIKKLLEWKCVANTLILHGTLNRDSLLPLWRRRKGVMVGIKIINVSALDKVDSAGLALLVHLREISRQAGNILLFTGINEKLQSLITLYNLHQIIIYE